MAFAGAIVIGTALLRLPAAGADGEPVRFIDALFTATSAVCVTGLVTLSTGHDFSTFGQLVILVLVQIGGLGIMTLATLFTLLVSRRLGLRARLLAQAETKTLSLTEVRRVVARVVAFSLISEAVVSVVLAGRFLFGRAEPLPTALYHGFFYAVSAVNNAGFSLADDSLEGYVADPWICLTVAAAVIVGGLGFPVVFELAREWRQPRQWSVVTRITLWVTVPLLVLGTVVLTWVESRNPSTLGGLSVPTRLLAGFFAAVTPRSSGFNTIPVEEMTPEGLLVTDLLMFIGGGSAGTAGGIKVTTFGLLAFVIWAEVRGETRVNVGRRRVPESNQRQALTIALVSVGAVAVGTVTLMTMTDFALEQALFETISAFATVGLSTGITADLGVAGKALLILLMFIGRIGPLTLASALALRERAGRFELPEERTIVG